MEAFKESSRTAATNAASLLVRSLTAEKLGHIKITIDSTGWRHGDATHTHSANATTVTQVAFETCKIVAALVIATMLAGSHRALTQAARRKDHTRTVILMTTCLCGSVSSINSARKKIELPFDVRLTYQAVWTRLQSFLSSPV